MCFIFALAGWEGTTHDAHVFNDASRNPNMNFPHPASKFVLFSSPQLIYIYIDYFLTF